MKLLILHNHDNPAQLLSKIYRKYKFLTTHEDLYNVKVHKINLKLKTSNYDTIYLDVETIDRSDERILWYLQRSPDATIIWVDVDKKAKSKMYNRVTTKIDKMSNNG